MMASVWALHGALGMAADWQALAAALQPAGAALVAPDLYELVENGAHSLPAAATALNARAAQQPGRRVLLGYSLGGRLALHALLENPHPWDAAIIVAAHTGLGDAAERAARLEADARWAALAEAGGWGDFLTAWDAQPLLAGCARAPGVRAALEPRRALVAESFRAWSLGGQADLLPRLGAIRVPVVWVVGQEDTKFHALGERAVAAMPAARLVVVAGCGHRVPWQAPAQIAALAAELAGA